jgi:hypothetical protein
MNVSIKREQSKLVCSVEREKCGMKSNDKVKSSPVISLSSPRFQNEADCFAIQAVWAKTCRGAMTRFIIKNRIDKPQDLFAFSYEGFTYESKLGERLRVGERSSWTSQAAEPSAGTPDFPHFIKQ